MRRLSARLLLLCACHLAGFTAALVAVVNHSKGNDCVDLMLHDANALIETGGASNEVTVRAERW